jgi:uncharacterized protein HemX
MTGWMWILVTVVGVVLLGLALWYGQQQSNIFRRNRRAVQRQDDATRRNYRE